MKSAEKVVPLRHSISRRENEETAFLPAALEIVETPASPAGRAIAGVIVAVFCVALAWAAIGKIDIVASARGQIIPNSRSKVIQPFETGVVHAIHVHDGNKVKAGDILVELDTTMAEADVNRLTSELQLAQLDVARLQAAVAVSPLDAFRPPQGIPASLIETQRQSLLETVAEHRSKLAALNSQSAQKKAEHASILAKIDQKQATLPMLQELVDIRKALLDKQVGSKLLYLEASVRLVDQEREVAVLRSSYHEVDAAIAALAQTRAQTEAEFRRSVLDDLAKAEQKVTAASQEIIKARRRTELQTLRAPIDGTVQEVAVHTIGGVVTPAQPLLVIVPSDDELFVRAMVQNRDIGFVHVGQTAEIKVDAFDFTRYGLINGTVLSVSRDAIAKNTSPQNASNDAIGAVGSSSEPQGQQLEYSALISLDRSQFQVGDKLVGLDAGEAVTVEIKTGSRTILGYLLSPVARLSHEALRDR